jgi:hypothetical protein
MTGLVFILLCVACEKLEYYFNMKNNATNGVLWKTEQKYAECYKNALNFLVCINMKEEFLVVSDIHSHM